MTATSVFKCLLWIENFSSISKFLHWLEIKKNKSFLGNSIQILNSHERNRTMKIFATFEFIFWPTS